MFSGNTLSLWGARMKLATILWMTFCVALVFSYSIARAFNKANLQNDVDEVLQAEVVQATSGWYVCGYELRENHGGGYVRKGIYSRSDWGMSAANTRASNACSYARRDAFDYCQFQGCNPCPGDWQCN